MLRVAASSLRRCTAVAARRPLSSFGKVLDGELETTSDEYKVTFEATRLNALPLLKCTVVTQTNMAAMKECSDELQSRIETVMKGGYRLIWTYPL